MDYYVYIITSLAKNWHYVGFTNNVDRRIEKHNNGQVKSTKYYKPFDLLFVQVVNNSIQARKLEKYLKIRYNKECVLDLIKK